MAHIDVNLDAVEDTGSELHPEGMLLVQVAKAEVRENKKKDGKYINWQLNPVESANKRPIYLMTSLKPEALWNLKRFLKECGVAWSSDGSFSTDDVLGCQVWVTIVQEEYSGEIRNKANSPYRKAA
jgi:hypothetical protein